MFKNGPWLFDKSLLILEETKANLRTSELDFKMVAFWLMFINLPIGFRNKKAAEDLGNNLGRFLEVDGDKEDLCLGNNLRIKVMIDITEPLPRGFMLNAEGVSKECWVSIRYERLLKFCYKCGRIGHIDKECTNKERNEQE